MYVLFLGLPAFMLRREMSGTSIIDSVSFLLAFTRFLLAFTRFLFFLYIALHLHKHVLRFHVFRSLSIFFYKKLKTFFTKIIMILDLVNPHY